MTCTVVYNFKTKPGLREQAVAAFDIMGGVAGLDSISLFRERENTDGFVCVEHWESESAHKTFLGSFTQEEAEQFQSLFAELPVPKICDAQNSI